MIVLALIQFGDGILCIRPVQFVRKCFEDVNFPREWWWVTPIVKFAAAAGLIAGIWVPWLGALSACALILYFLVAIFMHVRARDLGRNLFLNATGMLVICVAVTYYSFG
ncbi:DoxX family protein [Streptomyces sp. NPDC007346]|uniref:DoxX family protein n=1 Tax=Streptomyces sp. NPDC007346 TaxID=3154682 RepID=UPI003453C317